MASGGNICRAVFQSTLQMLGHNLRLLSVRKRQKIRLKVEIKLELKYYKTHEEKSI